MPGGHRWMYYATGLPGWMRFGFSPGWAGRSPTGLGPGATYLMTGQWPTPQAQAYWQAMQSGQVSNPGYAPFAWGGFGQKAPEQEVEMLRTQAEALGKQLEQIRTRISELEKTGE
jgi:acyl-coenzyme A synthetase/AMP-(fatty) acid ligase